MIGGEPEIVKRLDPIVCALAPGLGAATRTPVTNGDPSSAELGYLHCAPTGAWHFVKMVHNGIEDGMMPSYAEWSNILKHANVGTTTKTTDAEAFASSE
jgi:6-phosphogluconate dehydrogenase